MRLNIQVFDVMTYSCRHAATHRVNPAFPLAADQRQRFVRHISCNPWLVGKNVHAVDGRAN